MKPNLLAPRPPEHSVTTDPELVRQCVRQLKSRGAAEVRVADNPGGGLAQNIEAYIAPTGVVEASEGTFQSIAATPVTLKMNSRFTGEVHASRIITEVDVILNLPVFKTHSLTLLTGAVKNLFGIIPGGQKSYLHTLVRNGDEFAELLVDIYQAIPVPVLSIMDALRGMDGQNGPSGGRVLRLGRILAARNAVALDSVMAMMAGVSPGSIPTNRIAAERGLGPARAEDIQIIGDFETIPGFRLPSRRLAGRITGIAAVVAYPFMRRRPLVRRDLCTCCRRCADNCPAKAISMTPYPAVDRRKCISCYCCAEICPERAMVIPGALRGLVRRVLGR